MPGEALLGVNLGGGERGGQEGWQHACKASPEEICHKGNSRMTKPECFRFQAYF